MNRKYLLRTLGCKVNQYESQQIRELLESLGLQPADAGEPADLAVVNSCAVTATASAKTRQTARRLSAGGNTPVIVLGCGATADAQRLGRIPGVVGLWGHQDDIPRQVRNYVVHRLLNGSAPGAQAGRKPVARHPDRRRPARDDGWMNSASSAQGERAEQAANPTSFTQTTIAPTSAFVNTQAENGALDSPIHRFDGHQRAFLKVQDGCDACCAYCIVPRLRPTLRSKPPEAVVAEARTLIEAGHREIVLTGVYLGAFGRTTAIRRRWRSDERPPLADLVQTVADLPGLARLRLSSLEPGDVDDHLLDVLASNDCCVPHLHLPLQSGSSQVLGRMNRQYDANDYLAMIDRVQAALDRPAVTTDILVAFPGETEEDFEATLDMVRRAGFCKVHAFRFSPREGTAAARWSSRFVPSQVARERMDRLQETAVETASEFRHRFVGCVERVIVERADDRSDTPSAAVCSHHGRSDRYFDVHFEATTADAPRPGDVVHVRIDRITADGARGTLQASPADACPPTVNRHARA